MPYYCTVPRCTSMAGKAKNVSFHQFPRDEELAKLWNRILKRGKPYTKYSKVCSLHFKPEDYTITSVGKNKGQWRTLRKDAVPSQNLPSDSPAPYTPRRQSSSWVQSSTVVDPVIQQQMAQAIYMQTMLAIQAATSAENISLNDQPSQSEPTEPSPSSSSEIELLLHCKPGSEQKDETYQCQECSRCFKDPDVFLLHKRIHGKDILGKIPLEKENFSGNIQQQDTLRANPILANLLKTSMRLEPDNPNVFEANVLSVENQIMTALASNMEAYIKTLTSMLANQKATENLSEGKSDECSNDSDGANSVNEVGDDDNTGNVDSSVEKGEHDRDVVNGNEHDEKNEISQEAYEENGDLSIGEVNQGGNNQENSHCDSIVDELAVNDCDN